MSDECKTCSPHPFHGLRCTRYVYDVPGHPYATGPCRCQGPFATTTTEETTT
jgi:hypothetical protein